MATGALCAFCEALATEALCAFCGALATGAFCAGRAVGAVAPVGCARREAEGVCATRTGCAAVAAGCAFVGREVCGE